MMKTLYDQIRKYIFLFQLFALCPFGRNEFQNFILGFYSMLNFVVLAILSVVAMCYNKFIQDSNAISAMVVSLLFLGNSVTFVITILHAFVSRYDLKAFLLEIGHIDEIFQIKLQQPIDYATIQRKCLIKLSINLLVSNGLLLFIVMFLALGARQPTFLFWLPVTFSIFITNIRFMQNIFFVDLLRERLELLNRRLMVVAQRKVKKSKLILYVEAYDHQNRMTRPMPMSEEFDEILELKRIHSKIWNASILLNDSFGWSILAIVTKSFIGIICHGYWLYLGFIGLIQFDLIVDSAANVVLISLQLTALCWSCHNCTSCAEDTGRLLNKIEKREDNEPFNFLVREFSLQILHERIVLSANGFFNINLDLLGSLAAAALSYLVILIQFQSSEKDQAISGNGMSDGNVTLNASSVNSDRN